MLRVLNRQESQLTTSEPPAALQPPLPTAAGPGATSTARTNWTAAAGPPALQQQLSQGTAAAAGAGGAVLRGLQAGSNVDSSMPSGGVVDVNRLANELSTHLAIDQIESPQSRYGCSTVVL